MKIVGVVITLIFLLQPAWGLEGRVVAITDGDTIKLLTNEKKQVKVRLYGIDAPEKKQKKGPESKQFLSDLIFNKIVEVEEKGRDLYGRTIGRVFVSGEYVNEVVVKNGFAWYYPQYAPKAKELKDAQKLAKARSLGVWEETDPIAPWDYRKKK